MLFFQQIAAYVLSGFSHVRLFSTLQTVAPKVPLSMGFSRQEYWSGLPFPPLGDILDPGIEHTFLTSPALVGRFFTTSATWEAPSTNIYVSTNSPGQGVGWIWGWRGERKEQN